jgi:hypothetical protein
VCALSALFAIRVGFGGIERPGRMPAYVDI